MIQHFLKTCLFLSVLFFTSAFTNAYADSINGGWLGSNGDLIFMIKSSKGNVMALDVTAEKKLRYVFTGTMTGDQLNLATRDGLTTLDATVAGDTLTGVITPTSQAPQDLSANRWFTLPSGHVAYWPLLFIFEELLYYWFHRLSHTCRWFWATHAVHHSPTKFYLSGAYRLGWTGAITGSFIFFTPLFLIGFHPKDVFLVIGINLLYQYWLHTELIGRLPIFDWLFNSPANHRVHHATDAQYLDKNFGGILMLFDHCFGTYRAEDRKQLIQNYGVLPAIHSCNPIKIALHEWLRIAADLKASYGVKARFCILFGVMVKEVPNKAFDRLRPNGN